MAAPFDLVRQFDQVRQGLGGGPAAPPPPPPPPTTADFTSSSHAGHVHADDTPGSAHSLGVRPSGRLVQYGKYKVDESIVPLLDGLTRQFPGLRMSSGYRDPDHNRRVGGAKKSYHLSGRAVDFVGSAGDMQRAAAWARQNGAREVLIHNAGSGVHLHIAW